MEKIENASFQNPNDIHVKSIPQFGALLLNNKLENSICANILVSDDEVMKAFKNKYPSHLELTDEIKNQIMAELLDSKKRHVLRDWWKNQYNNLQIQLEDPAYNYLYNYLQGLKDFQDEKDILIHDPTEGEE